MRLSRRAWLGAVFGVLLAAYPWLAPTDYLLRVGNIVHAGDGKLHPNMLFDERVPGEA